MSLRKKMVLGAVGVGAALLLTAATGYASTLASDTGDHFSVPANTVVTGNLKAGTTLKLVGTIDGVGITVTCTTFTASGKTPATGLTITLSAPPTISGCTDTFGGTDTVKTNSTNGKWKLSEVDATNDETQTEPNTGDKAKLTIPKAGATFSSSVLSSCVVTAAPTGPASLTGTYDDVSTITDTNATIPVSGSGCTASTSSATATIVLSTSVHDVS